jgi:antibiotic biosynthesis monooxygenase (ABM) superfamily enzyme
LGIYLLTTIIIMLVFPWMNKWHWPVPLCTLVTTLMVVPITTYVELPVLQRLLRNWLMK